MSGHSVCLLVSAVLAGCVGNLSNVIFWPYVAQFIPHINSSYSLGMSCSGVLTSFIALSQNVGGGTSIRFSVTTYLLAMSAAVTLSTVFTFMITQTVLFQHFKLIEVARQQSLRRTVAINSPAIDEMGKYDSAHVDNNREMGSHSKYTEEQQDKGEEKALTQAGEGKRDPEDYRNCHAYNDASETQPLLHAVVSVSSHHLSISGEHELQSPSSREKRVATWSHRQHVWLYQRCIMFITTNAWMFG